MLYDSRWDRRPEKLPPRRKDWFLVFISALVPVFVASYAVADTYHELAYLLWPVGANVTAIFLSWLADC